MTDPGPLAGMADGDDAALADVSPRRRAPRWQSRENKLTMRYWESVGGTLVMEFHVVARTATSGKRIVDAIILPDGPTTIARAGDVNLEGRDVVVVQTKPYPMDLVNFGQALGGAELLKERFRPASVRAVAVCVGHDEVMERLANRFGVEVVVLDAPERVAGGAPSEDGP